MADLPVHPEKVRGTLSLTHKQAFVAFMSTLTIGNFAEIKEMLVGETDKNVERIEARVDQGFERMEKAYSKHIEDEASARQRLHDQAWGEIARTENRCEKRSDDLLTRISNLETYAFKIKSPKGS